MGKLSKFPLLKLEFLHEKCSKCGIKGDHRFVSAPCHTKCHRIHPGQIEYYHDKDIELYHPYPTLKHITSSGTTIRHSNYILLS